MRDISSPGFVINVIATQPELRIGGTADPKTLGKVLDRMTDVTERVVEFVFEDNEREHDVLTLKVDNNDLYFLDHPAWVKGNLVRYFFGYPGQIRPARYAVIDSVRGFLTLEIKAVEDAALANKATSFLWENVSIQDILGKMVAERRFGPQVTTTKVQTIPEVTQPGNYQQARQTDWQFLQRLAEPIGFEVYLEPNALVFQRRRFERPPQRTFTFWYGEGDLLDVRIKEWRTTDRPGEIEVKGRDPIQRRSLSATGSNTETERTALGNQNSLAITVDRAGALRRRPSGTQIEMTPAASEAAVRTEADTRFRRQEQAEVEITARIIGDPTLDAKGLVRINGLGRQLSGLYYVTKHVHRISRKDGYVGQLELIRNAVTATPSSNPPTLDKTKAAENTSDVPSDRRQVIRTDSAGRLYQTKRTE